MKTTIRRITLLIGICVLLSELTFTLVAANIMPTPKQLPIPNVQPPKPPSIFIMSPKNITYYVGNLTINFTVVIPNGNIEITKVKYYIDGEEHNLDPVSNSTVNQFTFSEGTHTIKVLAVCRSYEYYLSLVPMEIRTRYVNNIAYSEEVNATLEVHFQITSSISITSIEQNKTYFSSTIPLIFTTDKAFTKAAYTLDGNSNVTVSGNSTLASLSNGMHSVAVYTWDDEGNFGQSETIIFSIEADENFPVALTVIALAIPIAGLAVGIFYYYCRRHGSR